MLLELLKNSLIYAILLPGIVSLLLLAFGRYFGRKGSFFLATATLGLVLGIIFLNFIFWIIPGSLITYKYFLWINIGYCNIQWGFLFDSLSSVMLLVVSFISFLVHLYSINYMYNDPHSIRFMSYLSLFTFFMFILISGDNFLQLFLGWEGVGLCSYLLVSFWYTRIAANKAAIKALVINRIGDIALLFGMALTYQQFKSLNYSIIFSLCSYFQNLTFCCFSTNFQILTLISFFLFLGAVGKSAQLGLHTWLPDAMEGPTPVSALIHAATMVTAGVFLLIRCSPLLEYAPSVLLSVSIIGALTTFFAASIGLVQTDVKKIIAYSTCSQLGYMMLACGLSNYIFALYHLVTHAFFKALLFLGAGSIIHSVSDEQDYRKMGSLISFLPITYSAMVIGSCAIMGFPYLAGYYSKDLILEINFLHASMLNNFLQPLLMISTVFTIIYSLKLLFHVFLNRPNGYKSTYQNLHEPKLLSCLLLPLVILAICSIFSGYLLQDFFTVMGNSFFNQVIVNEKILIEIEFLDADTKLEIFFTTIFFVCANFIYYLGYSYASWGLDQEKLNLDKNLSKQAVEQPFFLDQEQQFKIVRHINLPIINIWAEFYILRIILFPMYIQHKLFSKPITSVLVQDSYHIDEKKIEFIFNRSLHNYKYPTLEDKSIFFNLDFVSLFSTITSGFWLKLLQLQFIHKYTSFEQQFPIEKNKKLALPTWTNGIFNFVYNFIKIYFNPLLLYKNVKKPLINIWIDFYVFRLILLPMYIQYYYFSQPVSSVMIRGCYYLDKKEIEFMFNRSLLHYKYPSSETETILFNFNYLIFQKIILPKWLLLTDNFVHCFEINGFLLIREIKVVLTSLSSIKQQSSSLYNTIFLQYQMPLLRDLHLETLLKIDNSLKELITKRGFISILLNHKNNNLIFDTDIFTISKIIDQGFYLFFKLLCTRDVYLPIINIWAEFYILRIILFPMYIQHKLFSKPITSVLIQDSYHIDEKKIEFIFNRSLHNYKYPTLEDKSIFFNFRFLLMEKDFSTLSLYHLTMRWVRQFFFGLLFTARFDQQKPIINIWPEFYILRLILLPLFIRHKFFSEPITAICISNQVYVSKEKIEFIFNRSLLNYKYPGLENETIFFNYNEVFGRLLFFKQVVSSQILTFIDLYYRYLFTYFATISLWSTFIKFIMLFVLFIKINLQIILRCIYNFFLKWYIFETVASLNFNNPELVSLNYFLDQTVIFRKYIFNFLSGCNYILTNLFATFLNTFKQIILKSWTNLCIKSDGNTIYYFLLNYLTKKWYFDIFQNKLAYFFLCKVYNYVYILFEKGLYEIFGPYGLARFVDKLSNYVIKIHNNKISYFSGFMFYSTIIILFLVCYML